MAFLRRQFKANRDEMSGAVSETFPAAEEFANISDVFKQNYGLGSTDPYFSISDSSRPIRYAFNAIPNDFREKIFYALYRRYFVSTGGSLSAFDTAEKRLTDFSNLQDFIIPTIGTQYITQTPFNVYIDGTLSGVTGIQDMSYNDDHFYFNGSNYRYGHSSLPNEPNKYYLTRDTTYPLGGTASGYQVTHANASLSYRTGTTTNNTFGDGGDPATYASAAGFQTLGQQERGTYYTGFGVAGDSRHYDIYMVPPGCTSVVIEAWGGGGGSGGSFSSGSPGNGGAGGYAATTLTVGTHIDEYEFLHCNAGAGGCGGPNIWYSGFGGDASAVYAMDAPYAYYPGLIGGDSTDFRAITNPLFNASNAILIAGGGGGGGSINWSSGSAGSGGSGGSANSGSGWSSGSGTGATTTSHGGGSNSGSAGNACACLGGGAHYDSLNNNIGYFNEASLGSIRSTVFQQLVQASDASIGVRYNTASGGGGGAFQGSPGNTLFTDQGSNTKNRGGGGGSNKVYKGINQSTATSNISSTPPNSSSTGGYAYGGVGKHRTTGNNNCGEAGMPGLVKITFN